MQTTGSKLRVLIVGGSADFRAVAKAWLVRHSRVESVDSVDFGWQALAATAASPIDLVLVDATLPDMDGFDATRKIKAMRGAPIVVILVMFDYEAVREQARLAGADACVDKSALTQQLEPMLVEVSDRPPMNRPRDSQ